MRYLGGSGRTHIQASNFNIKAGAFYSRQTTAFRVFKNSYLRVYAEPHQVDIDLHLYGNGMMLYKHELTVHDRNITVTF